MPSLFFLFAKYFWLLALILTAINAVAYHRRFRLHIATHPERAVGYRYFLTGFIIVNFLSLALIGLGTMLGGAGTIFDFLTPWRGNPCVIAFHAFAMSLWLVGIIWIYFGNGASFFVEHPGILNRPLTSLTQLKFVFAIGLLAGSLAECILWTQHWTPPPLP